MRQPLVAGAAPVCRAGEPGEQGTVTAPGATVACSKSSSSLKYFAYLGFRDRMTRLSAGPNRFLIIHSFSKTLISFAQAAWWPPVAAEETEKSLRGKKALLQDGKSV